MVEKWLVEFNADKTVNIDFSRKNIVYPNVNFGKHGPSIVQDKSHTYLGLCFQSDALWTSHIHTIHDKATKRLNILRMLKHKVNRKTLVNIYIAFIRPVLEYSDVVWDNCSEKDAKLLEDIQVEAARIITGLRCNSSRTKLYDELGWDLLQTRRKIHKLILLFKIINGLSPQYLYELLEPYRPPVHTYNLRTSYAQFKIPQIRTTSYMDSFFPSTVKQWLDLPDHIRNASSISTFKSILTSYFCRKSNELFNFGTRKYHILHCQLRNNANMLMADMYNHGLSETAMCGNCANSVEDVYHYFFKCHKYESCRITLFQAIKNIIISSNQQLLLELMLHGSPNHGHNINVQIFKAVNTFIAATKRFL